MLDDLAPDIPNVTPALESLLVASRLVGLLAFSSGPFSLGNTLRRPLLGVTPALESLLVASRLVGRLAFSSGPFSLGNTLRRPRLGRGPRRGLLRVFPSSSGPSSSASRPPRRDATRRLFFSLGCYRLVEVSSECCRARRAPSRRQGTPPRREATRRLFFSHRCYFKYVWCSIVSLTST
jgi:hypothetical protein